MTDINNETTLSKHTVNNNHLPVKVPSSCKSIYEEYMSCMNKNIVINSDPCKFNSIFYKICLRTVKYGSFM